MSRNDHWKRMQLPFVALAMILFICTSSRCLAQGIRVQSFYVDMKARPGVVTESEFVVQSVSPIENTTVLILPVDLSQDATGAITFLNPEITTTTRQSENHISNRSCRPWLKLATSVELRPLAAQTVTVRASIPPQARGFYYAGIILRTPRPNVRNHELAIVTQFLSLVRIQVTGPLATECIKAEDVTMQFVPSAENTPSSIRVGAQIRNDGETFGLISGTATLLYPAGNGWRRVTEVAIPTKGIFPDCMVHLQHDIGRSLPSGRYKLAVNLLVNGRPKGRLEREIIFSGDPTVVAITSDVALMVQPTEINVALLPGARRVLVVGVQNPTDVPLRVRCTPEGPKPLDASAEHACTAESFSCAPWMTVEPSDFVLKAGEQRRVRLQISSPATDDQLHNHYGWLSIQSTYGDGQLAGTPQTMPVWVRHPRAEPVRRLDLKSIRVEAVEDGKYAVTATFINSGTLHFAPRTLTASIAGSHGATEIKLLTENQRVLPLHSLVCSGVVNLSETVAGPYQLAVLVKGEGYETRGAIPIRVEQLDGRKIVTVIAEPAVKNPATEEAVPDTAVMMKTP
jgi:hypothetical protein